MNEFERYGTQSFHHLLDQGFQIKRSSDSEITYFRNLFEISIYFDPISYEIYGVFSFPKERVSISLQDILKYFGFEEMRGIYQIPTLDKMKIGVDYIYNVVDTIISKFITNENTLLKEIFNENEKNRIQMLENYYLNNDLNKADQLWNTKEYQKSKELYEKHIMDLSETQLKKLEYIRKQLH